MKTPDFINLVEDRIDKIRETLARKGKEYARGDRLSNFKRAAEKLRCSPERALIGIAVKHEVSILDMVDDIEAGCSNAPLELWEEKIGDYINYAILLEGLIRDRLVSPIAPPEEPAIHPSYRPIENKRAKPHRR
jgi:hypothetical protein